MTTLVPAPLPTIRVDVTTKRCGDGERASTWGARRRRPNPANPTHYQPRDDTGSRPGHHQEQPHTLFTAPTTEPSQPRTGQPTARPSRSRTSDRERTASCETSACQRSEFRLGALTKIGPEDGAPDNGHRYLPEWFASAVLSCAVALAAGGSPEGWSRAASADWLNPEQLPAPSFTCHRTPTQHHTAARLLGNRETCLPHRREERR